eukprot:8356011-Pyramimonas_sp.AAC.1
MDKKYQRHVDWPSATEKHRKLMQRDARPRAASGAVSSGRPPPWTAAGKEAARAAPPDQWTGAPGSGSSRRAWQSWGARGHQG